MTDLQVFKALDALKSADYLPAFRSLRLSKHDLKMLQTHYDAPEQTLTATQMAHALGYERHGTANAHYGRLATRVGEELGLQPELSLNVLATFDWPQGEQCKWIMRHQVAAALERLGLVATTRVVRFWTCHWQNRLWHPDINEEYDPVDCSASNSFTKRGVSIGDFVYIISLAEGKLMLGGRMVVGQIVSHKEALRILRTENLYEADEVVIAEEGTGTPLHLHRRLTPALARQLRFVSPRSEPKALFFVSTNRLDNQATRGVRELTPESAALLDKIIGVTDKLPRSDQLITVTEELLRTGQVQDSTGESTQKQDGAGFGNSVENKEVEEAAIRTVKKQYEADGWQVRSVERDGCGFDLECRKGQVVEDVEVKGVSGTKQIFVITAREAEQARKNPNFVLIVVTSALSASPGLTRYSGAKFCRRFDLSAMQYRAALRS
jgi:hypothetical protein